MIAMGLKIDEHGLVPERIGQNFVLMVLPACMMVWVAGLIWLF